MPDLPLTENGKAAGEADWGKEGGGMNSVVDIYDSETFNLYKTINSQNFIFLYRWQDLRTYKLEISDSHRTQDFTRGNSTCFLMLNSELSGISLLPILEDEVITRIKIL